MNEQWWGPLRILLGTSGPFAALVIAKTGIDEGEYQLWVNAILAVMPPLVAGYLSWKRNRTETQIKMVSDMPEVAKVVVKNEANGAVRHMAEDEGVPKVVKEGEDKS